MSATIWANAALTINVTGVVGSGVTTWSFSGSYDNISFNSTAELYSFDGSKTQSNDLNNFSHLSSDLSGEYATNGNHNNTSIALGAGASVTGSVTGIHNLDGLYLDSDGTVGSDDFGWYADGTFNSLETFTFSGSSTMSADINTFGEGATLITTNGDTFTVTSTAAITNLSMTFTAVPEPSHYAFLSGALLLGLCFLRRQAVTSPLQS
jgi:hypothetical protein